MVGRIDPCMADYFDGYFVLGVRAGDHDCAMHVIVEDDDEMRGRLEATILDCAAQIVKEREAKAREAKSK